MENIELQQKATGFIEGMLKPKQNTPIVSTPKDYGLDYEEVTFKTPDGVTLSAWLVNGGNNKVIIQAHPVTTNRSGFGETEQSKTAKAFADAGFTVLMFDARNHGQSENGAVKYAIGSPDDAPDFVGAVDYISSLPEYENANVGIHAQCFGVNATTHAFGLEDGLQSRENLKAISLTQPASWGLLMRPQAGDAFVDEVNKQLIAKGAKDLDATPLTDAAKINVPTLVVQNTNDPSGTLPFVEEFYNAIPTEKEKWMIDGEKDRSYAYYHLTTNPERLVQWFDKSLANSQIEKPILNVKGRPITQIGMVVKDIEKATKNMSEVFGIKDWTYLDLDEQYFENTIFHDQPKDTKTHLKVATANAMGVNFELLEPVAGESTHMEFLKKHGEGIHHISVPALSQEEFDEMMKRAKDAGVEIEMKSQLGKATTFTYFNMSEDIGMIFEAYTSNPNIQSTITPSGNYHYDGEGLLKDRKIWQLGIVVGDVEKAAENYARLLGIDNWEFRDIDIKDGTFRGKKIGDSVSVRIALANLENIQFELIEQTKGTGTHQDCFDSYGNGIHHLGISRTDGLNSYYEDVAKLQPKGVKVEMTGHITGGMFSYLDSKELLSGIMIETGISK